MKNHPRLNKAMTSFDAFLAGVRSAFGFSQSDALERYLVRQSVEDRIRANFERVGQHLYAAMYKVRSNYAEVDKDAPNR